MLFINYKKIKNDFHKNIDAFLFFYFILNEILEIFLNLFHVKLQILKNNSLSVIYFWKKSHLKKLSDTQTILS